MAVFLIALIIRGILFLNVISHPKVIFQPDSKMYVSLAQNLLEYGSFYCQDRGGYHDVDRMPGYPLFLAAILWFFNGNFLAVVVIQVFIDSLSCVLVQVLGESIWKGVGFLGGILAAFNMNMITYSHFILSDSLFLFIFLSLLILMLRYMGEAKWYLGIVLGLGFGIAELIRTVLVYIPILLLLFLFIYFFKVKHLSLFASVSRPVIIGISFFLILTPWFKIT